jgi:hypothetical protein
MLRSRNGCIAAARIYQVSYDFYLFRPSAEGDLMPQPKPHDLDHYEDFHPGPIDPAAEARNQAILQALRSANARLEQFIFDYEKLAEADRITVDDARCRYRHIELDSLEDDGPHIQLILWDVTATLTLPHRLHGETAQRVWTKAWGYLRIVERVGQYRTYDTELGRVLDLDSDFGEVLAFYLRGSALLGEAR